MAFKKRRMLTFQIFCTIVVKFYIFAAESGVQIPFTEHAKREPGENPGQSSCCKLLKLSEIQATDGIVGKASEKWSKSEYLPVSSENEN